MKELKQKVIQLGIERGYLPTKESSDINSYFQNQYFRLLEELGEAAREIRLENCESFEMEFGDCLVLLFNCEYIVYDVFENGAYKDFLNDALTQLYNVQFFASIIFAVNYNVNSNKKMCLQLAYNKIKERGGILIGNDYFKPTDPEYINYMQENENNI